MGKLFPEYRWNEDKREFNCIKHLEVDGKEVGRIDDLKLIKFEAIGGTKFRVTERIETKFPLLDHIYNQHQSYSAVIWMVREYKVTGFMLARVLRSALVC